MLQDETPQSWNKLNEEQLRIYAQELSQLYRKEQGLVRDLEEKNRALEQKIRELNALNSLFNQHLDKRLKTEEAYKKLVANIRAMAEQMERLLHETEKETPA